MKHTLKARFNAWALDMLDAYMHRSYGKMKRSMVEDHPEVILEVGAGTGSNLKYFRPGTRVLAIEPSGAMQERLMAQAAKYGVDLELLPTGIEEAPLAANSIDFVVTTLVLCTVPDLDAAVRKIHEVLRPGGRYVFLEHVAAAPGTFLRSVQDTLHDPWHYMFEGCHTNRDIAAAIRYAGFIQVEIREFDLKMPDLVPIKPQIMGSAVK